MRLVLAVLIAAFGVVPILMHSGWNVAQMQVVDFVVMGGSLLLALALILYKPREKDGQPQGVHTFTFPLELTSPLSVGQQLFLRPYLGENHDCIGITDERGEVFGFVPQEHSDYVLSRIEAHRLTHTVVEAAEEAPFGAVKVTVRISC